MSAEVVTAIEKLRVELARGTAVGLDVDMMDHAGYQGADRPGYERRLTDFMARRDRLVSEHGKLLARLRRDPAALAAWVGAQLRAIEALCVRWREDEKQFGVHLSVARETSEQWQQLLRGERDLVEVNVYYLAAYALVEVQVPAINPDVDRGGLPG